MGKKNPRMSWRELDPLLQGALIFIYGVGAAALVGALFALYLHGGW